MFCPNCGAEARPSDRFCGRCGTALSPALAPSSPPIDANPQGCKEALLKAIEQTLGQNPRLMVYRSDRTDLEIKNVLVDYDVKVGKKKVEYSACLLAREEERKVVFWEMLKEQSSGIRGLFAGIKVETYKSDGRTISGKVREVGWNPAGKAVDYEWDYAQTRHLVESVVKSHGWKFTTILRKGQVER